MKRSIPKFCIALLIAPCAVACESRPVSNDPPTTTAFAPQVALSLTAIDFGVAPCIGTRPNDAEIEIGNTGTTPLGWQAAIPSPDFTLPAFCSGTVEPGATNTVLVRAVAVPPSSKGGAVTSGVLVLTTDDPTQPTISVPLKVTASVDSCFL